MLSFDAEGHAYHWNGQRVPSVTQIISAALGNPFAGVPSDMLERKRLIGQATHRACELDSQQQLDESTVHPAVLPYLEAWRAFIFESGFVVLESERPLYCPDYGFAGRPDFYGELRDGSTAVIDLKTGLPGRMAALQTAGYAMLEVEDKDCNPPARFAVQALPSGRYRLQRYKHPRDWPDFLACLRVTQLKEQLL